MSQSYESVLFVPQTPSLSPGLYECLTTKEPQQSTKGLLTSPTHLVSLLIFNKSCSFSSFFLHSIYFFILPWYTRTRPTRTYALSFFQKPFFSTLTPFLIGLVISSEDRHFDSHKFENRSDRDDSYDYSHGSSRTAREERAPRQRYPQSDRTRHNHRYADSEVSKSMTNQSRKKTKFAVQLQ